MFDTRPALEDMACQIRTCRAADGLTLQQLATRSGVAASTIHKIEARQMVPTVSVLLKIAKGLGRRPEELIRDEVSAKAETPGEREADGASTAAFGNGAARQTGVWRLELGSDRAALPRIDLTQGQRAILVVEEGALALRTDAGRFELAQGDGIEIGGGRWLDAPAPGPSGRVRLTLVVSPPGSVARQLAAGSAPSPAASQTSAPPGAPL